MIDFIKKLFVKNNYSEIDLEKQFLDEELEKIDYFLLEKKELILKHIKNEVNLFKSDIFLTNEEKEKLGIN